MNIELNNGEFIHFYDSDDDKYKYWNSSKYILAKATKEEYPNAQITCGAVISNGYYFDFDIDDAFSMERLKSIEQRAKDIIKRKAVIESFTLSKNDAISLFKGRDESYKEEIINDILEQRAFQSDQIKLIKIEDYIDICEEPIVKNTVDIGHIKIISISGAYWKSNENNKMLKRIYAINYPNKKDLDQFFKEVEEEKNKEHSKLGKELELYTTFDYIGRGLPVILPNGTKVIKILQDLVENEEEKKGYQLVKTPLLSRSEIYKIANKFENNKDEMFLVENMDKESDPLVLRPTSDPFLCSIYKIKQRSYRDLPIKYCESSTIFKRRRSGEIQGLIRLRQSTYSNCLIITKPEELETQIKECVSMIQFYMNILDLSSDISIEFGVWDDNQKENYIGTKEEWEYAQAIMKDSLDKENIKYEVIEGKVKLYGPKISFQYKNIWGEFENIACVEVDFEMAHRFELTYTDSDTNRKYPICVHRTSIGNYERMLATLTEKYEGAFPVWLAPTQIKILTVEENFIEYAEKIKEIFEQNQLRVSVDFSDDKLGNKIHKTKVQKVPYICIVGEKEMKQNIISIAQNTSEEMIEYNLEDFIKKVVLENQKKSK